MSEQPQLKFPKDAESSRLTVICAQVPAGGRHAVLFGLIIAYLLATTYPYSLRTNGAELSESKAIFSSPGTLIWTGPDIDFGTEAIAIRLLLKSYFSYQTGPARILTISRDHHHSNLTIGQDDSNLVIRLRRERDEFLGLPPFVVRGVFRHKNVLTSIEVDVQKDKLDVYVNSELRLSQSLRTSPFRFWDPSYRIALGNEHTWERPWLGEIHLARIRVAAQEIDVLDRAHIAKAEFSDEFFPRLVLLPNQARDPVINLLVMIPFGFVTAWAVRRHRVARSMAIWFIVATCAEAIQALVPGRYPTLSDLVLNVLGVGLGAWFWIRLCRAQRRSLDN
jgi:hypothetical protein